MTQTPAARRRAPAMGAEERREAIIHATLPLLAEHGMNATTNQIASAAGIAEGTVFRVFSDKQELIQACVATVIAPEEGLDHIASTPKDLPLPEKLTRIAAGMAERMRAIGALMHSLMATGYKMERLHHGKAHVDREKWISDAVDALVDVIGPDAESLRLPPRRAAQVFLALVFSTQFAGRMRADVSDEDQIRIDELIDVFLHGVLTTTREGTA